MAAATPLKLSSGELAQFGTTDTIPPGNLGTGLPDNTTFLRGDNVWAATGDMQKSTYDTNGNGIVDLAEAAQSVPWSGITSVPSTFTPSAHTHIIGDVTGLQTALDGKASSTHTHIIGDVTGLQTALDGKANSTHTHIIGDVTGLQTALDGKEATGTAASAITAHEAALDPHPQYTTLPEIASVTKDIHGFIDRTSTTLSFDESTRVFTVAPVSSTWSVYILGSLKTITGSLTATIPNTTGGHFVRVNSAGTALEIVSGTPDFANDVYAVYIYWNATTGKALIVGDERHGSARDTTWHSNQHLNVGTIWRSGGAISYTLNNAAAVNIGFATPIRIADEDLVHVINHAATPSLDYEQILDTSASVEVMYLDGTAYTSTTQSTSPWIAGTSTARYNQITAGSGSLVDAGEGKYITYWVLATNDIRRPIKLVLGRQAHSSIDAAYNESFTDYGISFAEQVFMYQIVVQTSASYSNTAKVVIAAVRKIQEKLASSASTYSAGAHIELTGRESADQHPISAITNLQTTLDGKQETLVSGTNIKTVNSTSLLGSGDIPITSVANITGGAANQLLYQTAANTTGFVTAPVSTNTYLQWNGTNLVWSTVTGSSNLTVGTSTISNGTNGHVLYNNSGVVGGLATTGTGSVVRGTGPTITDSITSGAVTLSSTAAPSNNTTGVLVLTGTPLSSTAAKVGLLTIGPAITAADKNLMATFNQSINDYTQVVLQNSNSGAVASCDLVLNNDNTNGQGTYVDLGINSSGYTGTGSGNLPNAGYLTTFGGDLVLSTDTANGIHFVVNANTTDAASISSAGLFEIASLRAKLAAGTATINTAPLEFVAGTNLTTPEAGALEYDGKVFYSTHVANSRGVQVSEQFIARANTRTLTSSTALQSIFAGTTGSTNGALTVPAATSYFFECSINLSAMSGTSGNLGFSILGAGTATITSAAWHAFGLDATAQTTAAAIGGMWSSTAGQTGNIVTAATGTALSVLVKGIFRINQTGTIIPSVQLTTAATAVIGINTWFKCYPVGTDNSTVVGNWS